MGVLSVARFFGLMNGTSAPCFLAILAISESSVDTITLLKIFDLLICSIT
jgi:hypothetical protein